MLVKFNINAFVHRKEGISKHIELNHRRLFCQAKYLDMASDAKPRLRGCVRLGKRPRRNPLILQGKTQVAESRNEGIPEYWFSRRRAAPTSHAGMFFRLNQKRSTGTPRRPADPSIAGLRRCDL